MIVDDGISSWFVEEARKRVVDNGPHSSLPWIFCWGKYCATDGTATILADGMIAEAIWLYSCWIKYQEKIFSIDFEVY